MFRLRPAQPVTDTSNMLSFIATRIAQFRLWRALLFALFLCLGNPLVAKCPTYFVEIRGKVECSFKPDDKVLATLIFYDRQPAGSGEETAIDIHDSSFDGRISFDTYSSSFLFGGDQCYRRPKSVLVRLVEADGFEKDRTVLGFKGAFEYNEEHGGYTLKSDMLLHGSCPSQCCETSVVRKGDWQKVDAGPFSIFAPRGWEFHQLQGVDSYVGEFVGDGIALRFDYGGYSNPLKKEKKPAYVVTHKSIGGRHAKIVSPRAPGHGITGLYIRNVGDSNALTLSGQDLTSAQQDLALKIFETLRFGGPPPSYVLPPPPPPANEETVGCWRFANHGSGPVF
jgi:hypothetical protein